MRRQVGQRTQFALRKLLEKAFEREMDKLKGHFTYNFSREKPYFEMTLKVHADDFAAEVMEQEISILQRKLKAAHDKCERLERERYSDDAPLTDPEFAGEMTETIHEFKDDVIAHQKKGSYHRVVLCISKPSASNPQPTSLWTRKEDQINFRNWVATWDKVEQIPF